MLQLFACVNGRVIRRLVADHGGDDFEPAHSKAAQRAGVALAFFLMGLVINAHPVAIMPGSNLPTSERCAEAGKSRIERSGVGRVKRNRHFGLNHCSGQAKNSVSSNRNMAITTRVIGTIKQCQPYFYAEIKGFLIFLSQINRALKESQHLFKAPRCSDRTGWPTDWQAGFGRRSGCHRHKIDLRAGQ